MQFAQIVKKETLTRNIVFVRFEAPGSRVALIPARFPIIRTEEMAERIRMMIADWIGRRVPWT